MNKLFFIAEIGINHNGNIVLAKEMVKAAKNAGANAVKFQSITAKKLVSQSILSQKIDGFSFNDVKTLGDFWTKVSIDSKFQVKISQYCREVGIEFMSTPFDFENADILDEIGVKMFKIASGDITHFPLLGHIAKKGKPIILSTGASTIGEIEEAIDFIKGNGNQNITLLHCVSLYPTPPKLANLDAISYLKIIFNLPVGFSDHTIGYHIPIAAIAKGAVIIEKHFTLDKDLPGPDQKLSADPREFKKMVEYGSEVFESIKADGKILSDEENKVRINIRRSIIAAKDLNKGKVIELSDLEFKRPSDGVNSKYFEKFLGRRLNRDVKKDKIIKWSYIND